MANPEHLKILKQGVEVWNKWREENPEVRPDLSGADLQGKRFFQTNFSKSNFSKANLEETWLHACNLSDSDFSFSNLSLAVLNSSDLSNSSLVKSNLQGSRFARSDLSGATILEAFIFNTDFELANLRYANLQNLRISRSIFKDTNFRDANLTKTQIFASDMEGAIFINTNLTQTILSNVRIYGVSVWDLIKIDTYQESLLITPPGEPEITVDDLEVAQFIYLMLNNQKIRDVIETITSKAVLILGRFTPERKAVLDALKDELRRRNYLPIVFDFENAGNKSLNETMSLLARMSRFIVADITDAKAVREELALVVPQNPSVPVIPLVLKGQEVYSTFDFAKLFKAVLPLHEYESPEILLENIIPAIIAPAEQKVAELRGK